jgi:hypothetical protein
MPAILTTLQKDQRDRVKEERDATLEQRRA